MVDPVERGIGIGIAEKERGDERERREEEGFTASVN